MAISRRRLLQVGAGAGVLIGAPTVQHVMWNNKDFTRDGYTPELPVAPEGEQSWMNWSGIQRATPKQISFPETEQALADLLKNTSLNVRPVGSGHSFSGLAPSEGIMVDASAMQGLHAYDPTTGQTTFGAGTRLFDATSDLDKLGRAFPNLPDIDVQTMAGAFSTGTHGTGRTLTAMHDYITAFRMVTAGGDILDVTRQSNPDLFAAGKVSLGALGVITQYTVNTVPEFALHRQVAIEKVEPFLERIEAMADAHRNFEFYYSPSTRYVASITHDIHEGPIGERAESEDDAFLEDLQMLRDSFGWFPWLRRKIAGAAFPTGVIEDSTDESWQLLATTRPVKFNEMEYHIPHENGVATLRKIIKMLDHRKDAFFPIEFRMIAPDDAWLSPFNGGPRISIALHAAANERYDYLFKDFEPVFLAAGGRPHWGKLNSIGKKELLDLYPDYGSFLELRRDLDPTNKFLNPHMAHIFGEPFND